MTVEVKGSGRRRSGQPKPPRSTRVSRKNQITIPAAVLQATNLKPGDLLEIVAVGPGTIEFRRYQSRFSDVVGTLPGFEQDVDVEASRDQWS
ncbi:MAG TPA: AbrB/MazE/SpoVT family DNA-binding domain-containing protein [Mycobacteriales bacterium]|nr:AbrB/MazE/SpoVT family DNA-binding domain-containing protein [Mycobacteriales bacterium]